MFDRDEHPWDRHPWGGHPWGGHPWGGHQWGGYPWVHDWWPGMLLSMLNTMFWVALFIGLAWVLLRWVFPYMLPMLAGLFGREPAGLPPLEILRQRYAAGEIDAVTFEQMCERLEASYRRESDGISHGDIGYQHETWTDYSDPFPSPNMRERGRLRIAELEQYQREI